MSESKTDQVTFDVKTGQISFNMEVPTWAGELVDSKNRSSGIAKNWHGVSADVFLSIHGRMLPTKIPSRQLDTKVALSASKLGYHCPELLALSKMMDNMSPYDLLMVEPCVHILFRTADDGHVWDLRFDRRLEFILPLKM